MERSSEGASGVDRVRIVLAKLIGKIGTPKETIDKMIESASEAEVRLLSLTTEFPVQPTCTAQ